MKKAVCEENHALGRDALALIAGPHTSSTKLIIADMHTPNDQQKSEEKLPALSAANFSCCRLERSPESCWD